MFPIIIIILEETQQIFMYMLYPSPPQPVQKTTIFFYSLHHSSINNKIKIFEILIIFESKEFTILNSGLLNGMEWNEWINSQWSKQEKKIFERHWRNNGCCYIIYITNNNNNKNCLNNNQKKRKTESSEPNWNLKVLYNPRT